MLDIASFAEDQLAFIAAERDLEAADSQAAVVNFSKKELERRGLAITNLEICGTKTGFGGRTLVELERSGATSRTHDHAFLSSIMRSGDIVRIEEQPSGATKKNAMTELSKSGVEGVVSRASDDKITVALSHEDAEPPSTNGRVWVVKLANSITNDRMTKSMKSLLTDADRVSALTKILLGTSSPSPPREDSTLKEFKLFDTTLNASQQVAVKHALLSPEVALIHGPPGTGKTYTLIEIIRQFVKLGKRMLVCGPSNISVDNIVERLATTGVPLVRIGHPARLLPAVVNHSLDILAKTSPAGEIVKDIRGELDSNLSKMTKTKGKAKRDLYLENKVLRKEFRQRERKSVDDVLTGSAVVLATLHGSGSYSLHKEKFDVVIIDEASQALEASCWIPLLSATKVILAGDHMQLSPMIKSSPTASPYKTHPERTLFERLLDLHGDGIKKLLSVQYRMNSLICKFPSDELYEGRLIAGDGVGDRTLTDLKGVEETEDTIEPLIFIDTQGGEFAENPDSEPSTKSTHESKSNDREAGLVQAHVEALVKAGVSDRDIAIVTPYSAQVSLLSVLLRPDHPDIEIGTVDGFQGREKEVVIVSLVRSNGVGQVGFLSERKRLNVAMTRPKRQLVVVGDSETVSRGGAFMKAWMGWLGEHADLRYPET
ncbi:Putative uncharacterized protein [Taphrina deformans PYCC 5710]|uniref:DNA helicase n=1 Tax=Taphrina deformans (strain PYCC 5710 / ATCC 11124 / CBS 356.35 / IMI 108563 / JCM 9778 / NBRC 8474) TaxID=1097556 RepID=R4XES9_TAPDE|nr:Putative uncharacterized protein [Taphrina deformans PYCC 5710]|eukprot:CCG82981.1 Putative uncharacterized protein [Taphrina deformans PYCC 5710]